VRPPAEVAPLPSRGQRLKRLAARFERPLFLAAGLGAAFAAVGLYALLMPRPQVLTQGEIDAAVLHTLKTRPPEPSHASVATDVIAPSVVLVRRLGKEGEAADGKDDDKAGPKPSPPTKDKGAKTPRKLLPGPKREADKDAPRDKDHATRGLGTGVAISEDGLVITCLHVVSGAERIGLVFADGTETDADVVSVQPENDLAVLKPKAVPDDLVPATLRSTKGLKVGDEVVAVGFPFGIGPSTTYGVISGLRREHDSQEGQRHMIDLIQFDAAANPGNSGGPLVTAEGDVVGIVTSILNPTDKGFFVGIAFAVPIENAASAAGLSPF
jgi:S1-C subfamily serine protease